MILIKDQLQYNSHIAHDQLFQRLVYWATTQPEASFLVEAETEREWSYKQTLLAVCVIRKLFGDKPRRIVLALPGGTINAVCWLSALSGGHDLIPLAPQATDKEKLAVTQRYQPHILLVEQESDASGFASAQALVLTQSMCERLIESAPFLPLPAAREGYAYLETSGSTGEPKGVILSERQIAWAAEHIHASHELSPQDRGLTVLPFFHVNAPVVSLCASLLAGSSLIIAKRFSRQQFWHWIEQYKITWASIVPTIVAILQETEKPAFLPGSLRFIRTGSAALPAANLLAFEERFGIPLIETYGLSEAASQIVANPLPPGIHKPGSAGRPTGVALRICSPRADLEERELRDVYPGEVGEVCIAGPGVIEAYEHNEGQASFQDGWFRTGDLGYLDADGYLFLKGRLREVINRGGENIAPCEIEDVLQSYPAVREAAVVGRPDPIYGELVVAYLTVRTNWSAESGEHLRHYITQHLRASKIPVELIILSELPRNATGKIDRRLLRAHERARSNVSL
ncbi:MAG TPA: AMP-binding protein [Ktedonobacteraceae bacterium]|jgi:acyl-CoA synthetase (AMP-forming)/AMP-acid ligase II